MKHKPKVVSYGLSLLTATAALICAGGPLQAQEQKPNIIVIMGDDVGWSNIGAYNQGLMYSTTPNLDNLASQGMRFTDYYAEPSCTAGRANFITGELPIRTGLTTVGQAGATVGVRNRPVRQEPSGRPEPLPSDCARLRRVLRLSLPPRRDGRPVLALLSAGLEGPGRTAQPDPQLRHDDRRSNGTAPLGQDRQAEDRG